LTCSVIRPPFLSVLAHLLMHFLGPIDAQFINVSDTFLPLADGSKDKTFISESYDASSHFESATEDVLALYKRITVWLYLSALVSCTFYLHFL
jgi:RAB protein geranylgeranyltransferase component A